LDTVFVCCFAFGAAFTLLSAALSVAGGAGHGLRGAAARAPHVTLHHGHPVVATHAAAPAHGAHAQPQAHAHSQHGPSRPTRLLAPLLNASSLLAFLTWFGATGYLLRHVAGWPLLVALPPAVLAGLAAAALLGWFMTRLAAGEQVLDPSLYQLVGQSGRVTVGIPSAGVGEIVFSMAGTRRGEAARSLNGRAIPRGTEVVIVKYARGIADVLTLDELTSPREQPTLRHSGADGARE
jgi:hypothetical protein